MTALPTLTPEGWLEICDEIAELYPGSRIWESEKTAALFQRFADYPPDIIRLAVTNLFNEGTNLDTKRGPSVLMARTRSLAAERYGTAWLPDDESTGTACQHPNAGILTYWPGTDYPKDMICPNGDCQLATRNDDGTIADFGEWTQPKPSHPDSRDHAAMAERIAP